MNEEMMLTGYGYDSSSSIKPNLNFEKPAVKTLVFVDDSNRIDSCNLPE